MEWYYILIIIPAIIVTLLGYHKQRNGSWISKVTTKELTVSLAINILVGVFCLGVMQAFKYGVVSDYYILNGVVTSKQNERVSCEHSYQVCTSNGKTTTCVTYYEHSYDIDWIVKTSVGDIEIDRVDRRGTQEPPRFNAAVVGEPAAKEFRYSNYLLADPNSLFLQNAKGNLGVPIANVYDYYLTTHFFGLNIYNNHEDFLKSILTNKKYNVTFVIVKNKTIGSFYDLVKDWKGGKINEITYVINVDNSGKIKWVKGNSYAKGYKNQLMLKTTEDFILKNDITNDSLVKLLKMIDQYYVLHSENEFEEKIDLVEIPLFIVLLLVLFNFGVSIFVHKKMKESDI